MPTRASNPKASSLFLVFDYGGTKLSAGITDRAGLEGRKWLRRLTSPTPRGGAASSHAKMVALGRELVAFGSRRVQAIGASFGGPVDPVRGRVRTSHACPGWEDFPLREALEQAFDAPATVANDANAGAFGEWAVTVRSTCESLLYVTVSTGIGAGFVCRGRIHAGADALAGELGHTLIAPSGRACACGRRGCLEAEASGPALAEKFRARLTTPGSATKHEPRLDRALSAEDVACAALAGDAIAREVLDEGATLLGLGIGNAVSLLNPDRVILGGGVTRAGERYWELTCAAARAQAVRGARVRIEPATLGDDAPLWGSAWLAHEKENRQ